MVSFAGSGPHVFRPSRHLLFLLLTWCAMCGVRLLLYVSLESQHFNLYVAHFRIAAVVTFPAPVPISFFTFSLPVFFTSPTQGTELCYKRCNAARDALVLVWTSRRRTLSLATTCNRSLAPWTLN